MSKYNFTFDDLTLEEQEVLENILVSELGPLTETELEKLEKVYLDNNSFTDNASIQSVRSVDPGKISGEIDAEKPIERK